MVAVSGLMHRYLGAAYAIIICSAVALVWLFLDRDPPFVSLSYTATNATRGQTAIIDAVVKRDTSRTCNVEFSRFFIDASGRRWEVTPHTYMTVDGLRAFEKLSPGRLLLPVYIPEKAAIGRAVLVIPLSYRCNVAHTLGAIDVVLEYEFEVLP